ncbi:hypothetical protein P3X46_021159 [Hevea brasiliensis]|uniref:Epidermal patterning factor-like protein n=1 Tax=Hevea brasiliensis TaxID=3981 RepID=A0ABQ9LFW1_HEVBR|nr:hypothetical protein P3X46_021159 [Hevea brasiliensis]
MGSAQFCYCSNRNRHLIIPFLFLLLLSSILLSFVAEGRTTTKLLDAAQREGEDEKALVMRTQVIGSTPPRCERRCSSCGHCEAVQSQSHLSTAAISNIAYSRGDDVSNYKPMSWKCKCDNLIFNP